MGLFRRRRPLHVDLRFLVTTAGADAPFLGVVTLVSGGMGRLSSEVSTRVEYLRGADDPDGAGDAADAALLGIFCPLAPQERSAAERPAAGDEERAASSMAASASCNPAFFSSPSRFLLKADR